MTALMLIDYVCRYRRRNENTRARTEQHIDTRAIDIRGDVKITVAVEICDRRRCDTTYKRSSCDGRLEGSISIAKQDRHVVPHTAINNDKIFWRVVAAYVTNDDFVRAGSGAIINWRFECAVPVAKIDRDRICRKTLAIRTGKSRDGKSTNAVARKITLRDREHTRLAHLAARNGKERRCGKPRWRTCLR